MVRSAELRSLHVACPTTGENVEVSADEATYWSSDVIECDLCGSHGEITVSVKCPCGQTHEITLSSW